MAMVMRLIVLIVGDVYSTKYLQPITIQRSLLVSLHRSLEVSNCLLECVLISRHWTVPEHDILASVLLMEVLKADVVNVGVVRGAI